MKFTALPFVLICIIVFTVVSVSAQTINPAKLKLKGIGLDSTYAQVVKALGKPDSEEAPKKEECIGGREKSVKYSGISFYFMDGDSKSGKTFEVKAFEITAPNYLVSGVKMGDTPAMVKKKYGRKYTVDAEGEPGEITWTYEMSERDGPGTTTVVFKNGKVIGIGTTYQIC